MNFGFITTPLAYLNYKRKKAAYDDALKKYESLKDVAERIVDKYQDIKMQLDGITLGVDENGNINDYQKIDGLDMKYRMYVGALVGKYMSIGSELEITNNTDQDLTFLHVETEPTLMQVEMAKGSGDVPYIGYEKQKFTLSKGESKTIRYGSYYHIRFLSKKDMKLLRHYICKEAGKKLITSVSKGSVFKTYGLGYYFVTTDANMHRYYKDADGNVIMTQYRVFDIPGELVYMGEAWNPGLWSAIKSGIGF